MNPRSIVGHAGRLAVIDVETTGVFTRDRVVEVAVVTLAADGSVVDEWHSLVNPGRDVGPTWLHGISASMVVDAPDFSDIAAVLAERLDGAVLCAHNLPFDVRMLRAEFDRVAGALDSGFGVDTLRVTRCRLGEACAGYGVHHGDTHSALGDAKATAGLVLALHAEVDWPRVMPARVACTQSRRDVVLVRVEEQPAGARAPGAPVRMRSGRVPDGGRAVYFETLDRALDDLQLDRSEQEELYRIATDCGIAASDLATAHREYVDQLVEAALSDGVVTDDELTRLCRVAAALDIDQELVQRRVRSARTAPDSLILHSGLRVCFTGEAVIRGAVVGRDELHGWAERMGLTPVPSVTRSGCDLLACADVATASGKGEKARRYGIPICSVADLFETAVGGSVAVNRSGAHLGTAVVCPDCHATHLVVRRSGDQRCPDCRGRPSAQRGPVGSGSDAVLVCTACGQEWTRPRTRGRKPARCPDCAG